jgi:exopolyphosphatase/guanosine-5'-triphosphate,3'-diphosphate pyrophosphatase
MPLAAATPAPPAVPVASAAEGPFYGALDLGTNNCRLLIATPREHGFRVVDAFSRIVRLGEGIGANGRLSEAAMTRAIEALKVCGAKLAERNVARVRMIATEACRAAENGAAFIERVRTETGLAIEIVSQEAEARLAVAGCASLVDGQASGVILFDIGGGSSELVWIDLAPSPDGRKRRMADRIRTWMSLPVGVVNVSERHGGRHITPTQFAAMVDEVTAMIASFPQGAELDAAVARGGVHMLGTSGTVTTLAGIHLGLPRYDRRKVDGVWLTGERVAGLIEELVAMDYDQRVANPCIGRERADLVLAGCAILEAIRRRWPCERLRVADRGLREGVLVEMMATDGVWRSRSGRRAGERFHA